MPDTNTPAAGIDVSKSTLDTAIHGHAEISHVPNTPAGCKALAVTLAAACVVRVGIEANGGYERRVIGQLREQGIEVSVLQPMQVKAVGMMHLRRASSASRCGDWWRSSTSSPWSGPRTTWHRASVSC